MKVDELHPPAPPEISPCLDSDVRPFWSVMIPTYNPSADYLEAALHSVLEQDLGPEQMQIGVIDDCSPGIDVAKLVEAVGSNRVGFLRHPQNLGMAGNWNSAVRRARGQWVHILHQDDLVLPGFYERLREGIEADEDLGAAYTQSFKIDGEGRRLGLLSLNPASTPSIVEDWMRNVFVVNTIMTPSIVVRRAAYEKLGGFRPEFRYSLDWDMWKRLAAAFPVWFDPTPLACYRRHDRAATIGFLASGENIGEKSRSITIARSYLPTDLADRMEKEACAYFSRWAMDQVLHSLWTLHEPRFALAQLSEARKVALGWDVCAIMAERVVAGFRRWLTDHIVPRHGGTRCREGELP